MIFMKRGHKGVFMTTAKESERLMQEEGQRTSGGTKVRKTSRPERPLGLGKAAIIGGDR